MSTRSRIIYLKENGTAEWIYCHWDGYLDYAGKILNCYYRTPDIVKKLIKLGDISSLGTTPETKKGEDNPEEKNLYGFPLYTVSYNSWRDEPINIHKEKSLGNCLNDLLTAWEEFFYIFDEKQSEWHVVEPRMLKYLEEVKIG